MPSTAFLQWQNDRMLRLGEVESHCAAVIAMAPPNLNFADETLRDFVLHLSAHFQGFCRDLYSECSQTCVGHIAPCLQTTAQVQFLAHLALESGNPSYANLKRDFNRFGFSLDLHIANAAEVTDLSHLMEWRNKAAHQGTKPLASGVPASLTLPVLRGWKASCDRLSTALDAMMHRELLRVTGVAPW